jgi:hypothetical protein
MYSLSGNCASSDPTSTFMCLWAIYIFLGVVRGNNTPIDLRLYPRYWQICHWNNSGIWAKNRLKQCGLWCHLIKIEYNHESINLCAMPGVFRIIIGERIWIHIR